MPRLLGDEIYRIVQEVFTNARRHARASRIRVIVTRGLRGGPVRTTVADDGCGFAFRGRHDLALLTEKEIGPRSLREPVAAFRGDLVELSGSSPTITQSSSAG